MRKISYLASAVCVFPLFFASVLAAGNVALTLTPPSATVKVAQTFDVVIYENSNNESIDMVRAKINFPADLLEVKNFTFAPGFIYPATDNSFDNTAGTLSFGAGAPGGLNTSGVFGTVTFSAKKLGSAQIKLLSDSYVLSEGENKFNGQSSAVTVNIEGAATPVPTKILPSAVKKTVASTPKPSIMATSTANEQAFLLDQSKVDNSNSADLANLDLAAAAVDQSGSGGNARAAVYFWLAVAGMAAIVVGVVYYLIKNKKEEKF